MRIVSPGPVLALVTLSLLPVLAAAQADDQQHALDPEAFRDGLARRALIIWPSVVAPKYGMQMAWKGPA